jgi:hypothetical protein
LPRTRPTDGKASLAERRERRFLSLARPDLNRLTSKSSGMCQRVPGRFAGAAGPEQDVDRAGRGRARDRSAAPSDRG